MPKLLTQLQNDTLTEFAEHVADGMPLGTRHEEFATLIWNALVALHKDNLLMIDAQEINLDGRPFRTIVLVHTYG